MIDGLESILHSLHAFLKVTFLRGVIFQDTCYLGDTTQLHFADGDIRRLLDACSAWCVLSCSVLGLVCAELQRVLAGLVG